MVAKVHCLGPHTSVDVPSPPPLRHTQVERAEAMVAKVHSLGPHTSVDVDQLALRVTLDVIGLVGEGADLVVEVWGGSRPGRG